MFDSTFPVGLLTLNAASYTMVDSKPVYCLVIASQDRVYDCVQFMMSGLSMTSFYVAVFTPTSATSLTRIMNVGSCKAQMSGAGPPYLRTIALPDPLDAVAGEKFYVGLLAVGGTMPVLGIGTTISDWGVSTSTIPEWNDLSALDSGTQTTFGNTTETITKASMNAGFAWAAMGNAAAPLRLPAFFMDNFNQINMSEVVLPWQGRSAVARFGIYNQTMSPQTGATGAFNYWVPSVRDNDHYIQAKLGADMATAANRTIDLYMGVRGARGGTGNAVKLHIDPSGTRSFRIVTVTTAYNNGGLVQRAAADPVPEFAAGDVVKLVADGTVYAAFHNDLPIISWTDSGVLSPVDADHQRVSIGASATSVANLQLVDNFEAGAYGGGVQLLSMSGIPSAETFGALTIGNNIVLTPTAAALTTTLSAPTLRTGSDLRPGKATLALTGYAPRLFTSTTTVETNTARTNQAIPANALGAWVTLQGGGAGGGGSTNADYNNWQYGGGGGGGGARIRRTWVTRAAMGGTTYSVTIGGGGGGGTPGGGYGWDGDASTFTTTLVTLTAGGGKGGGGVSSGATLPSAGYGTGGVASYSGVTPDYQNGARGGVDAAGAGATYAGAGGGAGGRLNSTGAGVSVYNGNDGGATSGATGGGSGSGSGGTGGASSDDALYGGGGGGGGAGWSNGNYYGGNGGVPGGGGGGAGPTIANVNNPGGDGAAGMTIIEWVIQTEL